MAEAVLARRLRTEPARVRSAGTLGVGPVPALPGAVRAAARVGIDLSHHRAHSLRLGELEGADLVVGFEPGHLSAAVIDGGAQVERTFSLVELGLLLRRNGTEAPGRASPASVVQHAHERRPIGFLHTPTIADPHGASDEVFVRTLEVIAGHVSTIADALFGATASSS